MSHSAPYHFTLIKVLIVLLSIFSTSNEIFANGIGMQPKPLNLSDFPADLQQINSEELNRVTPEVYYKHPEFGVLPHNTQCFDCIELIQERTTYTRKFIKRNSEGKIKYIQKGYDPLHYKDGNGDFRSIDERLRPHPSRNKVYYAPYQENITEVDLSEKDVKLKLGKDVLIYNQDLRLISINANGDENLIAKANWSNAKVGADGLLVANIFQGIDMEVLALRGAFKTNFIVKNTSFLPQDATQLMIRDNVELPKGYTTKNISNDKGVATIYLVDASGNTKFTFHDIIGVENQHGERKTEYFNYAWNDNSLDIVFSADWLRNALSFPLYIDPLVTTTGTLPQVSINGSGLNNVGNWVNSCDYFLSVATPANSTVTDVLWSFTYIAQNGSPMADGALTIFLGNCRSPGDPNFFWTCQDPIFGGPCTGTDISIISDFTACMPSPQCTPVNLDFTMNFFDSFGGPTCSNNFIGADSDWIMTVEARTVEHPDPITSSSGTDLCLGESTTLNAQGNFGVPPYTYEWTPGNLNGASVTVSPIATTTYTVEVTDACNIQAIQDFTVNIVGPEAPVVTGNGPLCEGEDIELTANSNGATSYSWTGPNAFSSNQQNPTLAAATATNSGTYSVEASGAGCTTDPVDVSVTINPGLTITNIDTVDVPCNGTNGSAEITVGSGTAPYNFDLGGGLNNTTGIFPTLSPGTYNLIVTDDNGCETNTSFVINPDTCCAMTNTIASSPITCNGACDGTITLTETDGIAPVQFSIDSGATLQNNGDFTGLCAGTYNILIVDADSCFYTNQVVLDEPQALNVQSNTTEADCGVCNGGITLNASGGTGNNYTYSIDNGNTFQAGNTFSNLCPNNYDLVVRDSLNCSSSLSVLVDEENNTIVLSTDVTPITCNGANDGEIEAIASSNNPPLTYEWSNSFTNPTISGLAPGIYIITVADQNNCSRRDTVDLTEPLPLEVDLGNDQVLCFGESTTLTPGNFSDYLWSTGDSIANIEVLESGTYAVTVEDQSGCEGTGELEITVIDDINLDAGSDTTLESFQSLQLQALVNGSSNASGSISWTPSDFLSCADCFNPIVNLSETQEYLVDYTDPNGCTAVDTILITLEEGEYYIYMPNAFSPNGDGINDIYAPIYSGVERWVIRIYDRWGEKVFESRDFDELWDGTRNGNDLPPDVYVYHLYSEFLNLEIKRGAGSLTLVR